MDRNDLISTFERLSDNNNYPTKIDLNRRGREFEVLLRNLLELEQLAPKYKNFRPRGEELDGSFLYGSRIYLLEAKWHADPLPASSIYQFKGKVDGKLVGTIGVFISMSGFSNDAIDALIYGKSLNVLLFDGKDIEKCIRENMGFTNGLEKKLRAASESGLPFYSLQTINIQPKIKKKIPQREPLIDIAIIVEGHGDQDVISFLAEKILEENGIKRNLMIRTAGGKISVPRLANAIDDFSDGKTYKFILVADADNDADETANFLSKELNAGLEPVYIIPDPEIETWFQPLKIYDRNDLKNFAKDHNTKPSIARMHLLRNLDIQTLFDTDESFRKFYNALIE